MSSLSPGDSLSGAPGLVSTSPKNGEKDVPPARSFFLEFSEPMDTASVTLTLSPPHLFDVPAWTDGGLMVLIRPTSPMAAATSYEVQIAGKSVSGVVLPASSAFSFATSVDLAEAPPQLISVSPPAGASQVGLNASLSFRFSKPMDTSSVRVTLSPDVPLDEEVWSLGNQVLTLANPAGFAQGALYTATVAGKDLEGVDLTGNLTHSFTTSTIPDTTAPTVQVSSPSGGAQGVSLTASLSILFSEPMRTAAAQGAFSSQPPIACAFSFDQEKLLTCKPSAPLTGNTNYQVTIGTGATDSASNPLNTPFTFSFRTAPGADTSPPSVASAAPGNNATGRALREPITIVFSEPMALGTTQSAFSITTPSGYSGSFQWNAGSNQLTFTPSRSAPFRSTVTWRIATSATDSSGNPLANAITGSFQVRNCIVQNELLSKYNSLGGSGSFLGQCLSDEQRLPDGVGRFNDFQGGSLYFTPATGAHEVHGPIRSRWAALGWEQSPIGYPITDQLRTPDGIGRFNRFQRGMIYWTPATGAHEVHGAILDKWTAMGYELSVVGYPITDEIGTPDGIGRFNHFQTGSIYFTVATGAHEVHGAIRDKWAALGYERSFLGYPVTDELAIPGGRQSDFQGGYIRWEAATGIVTVVRR